MKKLLFKTNTLALAFIALFTTTIVAPAFATDPEDKNAEVRYVGNLNDMPVYRLFLKNAENDLYFITVSDNDGTVLYSEKVSGTNITRNYQLNSDMYGEYDFTFTIANKKGKTVSVYNVNKRTKVIEEVAINRVK